jgi:predicted ATPase/DNA-binding XRE family transcriptional regulator
MEISSAFGALLRRHRLSAGLSQVALAGRAGLSRRGIADLERGARRSPYPRTVGLLARALALGPSERAEFVAASSGAPSGASGTPAERSLTSLPVPLTSFVGREQEAADIQQLLTTTRLLTLTGVGGIGKTCLAFHVAGGVDANYPDGVRLVEIAPLTAPRLLAQTVASVLGVSERPGKLLIDTLITFLRPKHLLLLLDNCEHLIEACATLVDALLQKCPELTILTTSREPLDISGEVIWQVPPMAAPSESEQSAATLVGYESARLFVDRAQATLSHFVLTDTNAPANAQICRRLEGVPLALELAAARVRGLAVEEIAAHLEHRFALLTQGSRVAPARHQMLRGLIDWSYTLLSAPEQLLFSRLAIFAVGFSAEAAQSVCGEARMDSDAILDLLLRNWPQAARQHAVALRHARYFLERAEVADTGLRGSQSATCYAWLDREHENLRSALRWLIEVGNDEQALRLAAALGWFWYVRGHLSEAQASLETVRRLPVATPRTALRSRACFLSAAAAWFLGDYAVAFSLADEALAIGREVGAFQQIGQALTLQAGLKSDQGDYADARALLAEGLAACQAAEDDWSSALALYWLGVVSLETDDVAQARTLQEQALAIRRRIGDGWSVGSSVGRLAEIATQLGDYPATRAYAEEALAIARQLGNQRGVARNLWYLGTAALGRGDDAAGQDLFQASLAIWLKIGERAFIPRGLEGIAAVAAARLTRPLQCVLRVRRPVCGKEWERSRCRSSEPVSSAGWSRRGLRWATRRRRLPSTAGGG